MVCLVILMICWCYLHAVEEYVVLLDNVFALFAEHKLFLKEKKCLFVLSRVNFLGM